MRLSETDLEDEGCGEVYCEREEQREYTSFSVFFLHTEVLLPAEVSLSESATHPSGDDRPEGLQASTELQ